MTSFHLAPMQALKYLARYTHRVAIANSRLLDVADGTVAFGYKDYATGDMRKAMALTADEFLRRLVQHVLPKGFVKVRHYGLLANRHLEERLQLCRALLRDPVKPAGLAAEAAVAIPPEGARPPQCPHCGGMRFERREVLPRRVASVGRGIDSG